MRVSLSKSERGFSVAPEQPVLDAALGAGLNLPHSCKGGNCGACRARLLQGEIRYPSGRPLGLTDAEMAEGFILLCQARAASDLCIDVLEVTTPDEAVIKRLPGRIERVDAWSHDVMGVFLRLPAAETFHFEPGQYVDILLPGGRRRSFSIASPPHDSGLLELHIRRVAGGEFTERLFAEDARKTLLSIEGPLGRFVYRSDSSAPMLLVGGGTGLAPLKSILRHVVENGSKRQIYLYWGVRSERDLYAHAELEGLTRSVPNFRYDAVLSDPSPNWQGRRGWVHEAVLHDFERLDAMDIYASGPPAMISSLRHDFDLCGADAARLFFDSFDYAPDAVARHRLMAAAKS
ncbi:MAG: CDP-6-deoxy-delta-3,4-glucoseen reductase [Gammaproteobacteria bacterium]|nr:CDP-6-deoxy-delta-3,4-glucoseen reductase [Gammaproteobacteria bacterium]